MLNFEEVKREPSNTHGWGVEGIDRNPHGLVIGKIGILYCINSSNESNPISISDRGHGPGLALLRNKWWAILNGMDEPHRYLLHMTRRKSRCRLVITK